MPIFHVVTGLIWLFVLVRFVIPLPWSLAARGVAALVLLLGSQHHLLARRFYGAAFSPEVPRPLGMLANTLFGTLLLLATFQVMLDLLTLASSLLHGSYLAPPQAAAACDRGGACPVPVQISLRRYRRNAYSGVSACGAGMESSSCDPDAGAAGKPYPRILGPGGICLRNGHPKSY